MTTDPLCGPLLELSRAPLGIHGAWRPIPHQGHRSRTDRPPRTQAIPITQQEISCRGDEARPDRLERMSVRMHSTLLAPHRRHGTWWVVESGGDWRIPICPSGAPGPNLDNRFKTLEGTEARYRPDNGWRPRKAVTAISAGICGWPSLLVGDRIRIWKSAASSAS